MAVHVRIELAYYNRFVTSDLNKRDRRMICPVGLILAPFCRSKPRAHPPRSNLRFRLGEQGRAFQIPADRACARDEALHFFFEGCAVFSALLPEPLGRYELLRVSREVGQGATSQ